MTNPTEPHSDRAVVLDAITVGVRHPLNDLPMLAATMRASIDRDVYGLADRWVLSLCAQALTERLPPQRVTSTGGGEHAFDVHTIGFAPRWASWWDHLKATYAARWWMRPVVRRSPPRTAWAEVHSHETVHRSCVHHTTVDLAGRWVYPHASYVPPEVGYAVLRYDVTAATRVDTSAAPIPRSER